MQELKTKDIWVERFIDEVLPKIKKSLRPTKVIIFGSRVKGCTSEESDIDIIIVSDFFRGRPFLGRMPSMLRMFRFPCPVDFLCYSPEEFGEISSRSIIIEQALKEGVEVT